MLDIDPVAHARCVAALRWAMACERDYPGRQEIIKKLKALGQAARVMLDALEDLRISELVWGANDWLDAINMAEPLRDVIARSEQVIRENPLRQGRGQLYPDDVDGPSPHELCALIVSVYLQQKTGCWPGKDNAAAIERCGQLWVDAGGRSIEYWRDYLRSAKQFEPPHMAGRHVIALLGEGEKTPI